MVLVPPRGDFVWRIKRGLFLEDDVLEALLCNLSELRIIIPDFPEGYFLRCHHPLEGAPDGQREVRSSEGPVFHVLGIGLRKSLAAFAPLEVVFNEGLAPRLRLVMHDDAREVP